MFGVTEYYLLSYNCCSPQLTMDCIHLRAKLIDKLRKNMILSTQRLMFTFSAAVCHEILCKRKTEPSIYTSNLNGRTTTTNSTATLDGFELQKMQPCITWLSSWKIFSNVFLGMIYSIHVNLTVFMNVSDNNKSALFQDMTWSICRQPKHAPIMPLRLRKKRESTRQKWPLFAHQDRSKYTFLCTNMIQKNDVKRQNACLYHYTAPNSKYTGTPNLLRYSPRGTPKIVASWNNSTVQETVSRFTYMDAVWSQHG